MSAQAVRAARRVAIVGAGLAGAACAAGLQRTGVAVTVFDKSRGVGGRMATRRAAWAAPDGAERVALFDHGVPCITAHDARFRAVLDAALAAGVLQRWQPRAGGATSDAGCFVALPSQPALARHLLGDAALRLGRAVTGLQRHGGAWQLAVDGAASGSVEDGLFDAVVLALPPAQAAVLLGQHHAGWAQALSAVAMQPCWTLMAASADVPTPFALWRPAQGPLARVLRNDGVPGRGAPPGVAHWVAQATPAWSGQHLEDAAETVRDALLAALAAELPGATLPALQHAVVHRWRYAQPAAGHVAADGAACWWDAGLGLGVCGDHLGSAAGAIDTGNDPDRLGLEAAWRSGDALAAQAAAALP